jgi:hypothetical protein
MASACIHGRDDNECSSCNETWEAELSIQMGQLSVTVLQRIDCEAKQANDQDTQRHCALAMGYVLNKEKASEVATDAARELAILIMAEK